MRVSGAGKSDIDVLLLLGLTMLQLQTTNLTCAIRGLSMSHFHINAISIYACLSLLMPLPPLLSTTRIPAEPLQSS